MDIINYETYKEALNSWHVSLEKPPIIMESLNSLATNTTNIDKNTASTFNFSNTSCLKDFLKL